MMLSITNINIYLVNIFQFFYQSGFTGRLKKHLSACSPRPHNAPRASDRKGVTYALEWLTAQSIILTEQMGRN